MFGDQWLAKNAARRYPLDELASAVDDYGSRLPDGFIVDVCLTIPGGHSQRVGILGASVQENGVSVVFGDVGNPADPSEVPLRLLATASITGAATRAYRPVVVTPLLSGVGGLVTFGPRADGAPASWVFSGTNATLAPRCVRTNGSLTPGTLSLAYSETSMNGAVRLVAGSDLEIVKESREIGTVGVRDAVVFRLVLAQELEKLQGEKAEREKSRYRDGRTTNFQVLRFEDDYSLARIQILQLLANARAIEAQARFYNGDDQPW
jgi:hypothetical protein